MATSVWYRAGTISIPANSKIVTGTNTKWADSKQGIGAGQMLLIPGAGTVQLYEIASIDSDTQITLNDALVGAAISGSNYAIPIGITGLKDTLILQTVARLSYYQSQMDGWQKIMTGEGNITLTAPDGTSVTISSFKKLTSDLTGKADLTNGAVSVGQGGTGQKNLSGVMTWLGLGESAFKNIGSAAGTVAAGNDTRITGALQRTGGTMTSQIFSSVAGAPAIIKNAAGAQSGINYLGQASLNNNQYMTIDVTGTAQNIFTRIVTWNTNPKVFGFYDNGNGTCDGSWISGSDERHKSKIKLVPNALEAVLSWRGCTYLKKDGMEEVGLIAQDVEKSCPTAVMNTGLREFNDGTVIEDFKSLNTAGAAAAYHTEAIKALFSLVELALVDPEKALSSIDDIKAALSKGEATS